MKDGGQVYPQYEITKELNSSKLDVKVTPGMTLRQYYVGQALAGLSSLHPQGGHSFSNVIAKQACEIADEALKQEESTNG